MGEEGLYGLLRLVQLGVLERMGFRGKEETLPCGESWRFVPSPLCLRLSPVLPKAVLQPWHDLTGCANSHPTTTILSAPRAGGASSLAAHHEGNPPVLWVGRRKARNSSPDWLPNPQARLQVVRAANPNWREGEQGSSGLYHSTEPAASCLLPSVLPRWAEGQSSEVWVGAAACMGKTDRGWGAPGCVGVKDGLGGWGRRQGNARLQRAEISQ